MERIPGLEPVSRQEETISQGQQTLFQEKADAYQNAQDRTKKAGITTGLSVLVVSVLALIVSTVLQYGLGETCGVILCVLPIVMIGSALGIVGGIVWTVVNLVRPTKLVTCSGCGTEHRIYRSVRKYMCTNCRAMLLLGKDVEMRPQFSACPCCGLRTAVSADHGRFICPNCGIVREPAGTRGLVKIQSCPECNQPVPEGAIYCMSCGSILKVDFSQPAQGDPTFAYDQDWKTGKNATGHLSFAKAILKGIRKGLGQAGDVEKVQALMTRLEDTLLSVEEAWQESVLRPSVEAVLPDIDLTYAALLESELRLVQALGTQKLEKDALKILAAEPHITPRRRVEDILEDALQSSGSIGKWGEKLVDVEQADKFSRVKGYETLKTEVDRFVTWREQQEAR